MDIAGRHRRGRSESRDVVDSLTLLLRHSGKAMLAVKDGNAWEVLGTLTATGYQTLEIVMNRESVTSAQLSSLLGVKLTAASTRLKNLYDRDLVARYGEATPSDGGRDFVYQRLFSGPDTPGVSPPADQALTPLRPAGLDWEHNGTDS